MKTKKQKPFTKQKWNKRIVFYHNKGSNHFFLSVAKRGDFVAGFDMTTHPSLTISGNVKRKYIVLIVNPNPNDYRASYVDKKFRSNLKIHFSDSGKRRLTKKKNWKLNKKDKKRIKKLSRNKIKNPHNSI